MSIQLAIRFNEVPITCETQQRYHSIVPCLAGKRSAGEQADALGLSYSTVCRWLGQFREEGMPGLFPSTDYPRQPQTPERVIVALLYYKTCAPGTSDPELARVLSATTDHRIHYRFALSRRQARGRSTLFNPAVGGPFPNYPRRLSHAGTGGRRGPARLFSGAAALGIWEEVISDHGGQFISHDFQRVNKRLGIRHDMYEKGHPWQNLIESQFGIQARLGEYHRERCRSVEEAVEFHRDLIRDHNRLPHWAHHRRNDGKHSPLAVLGDARGKRIEPADLQRAFGQRYCQRRTDARGFVRIGRWKIYIEESLPRTHIQLLFWDGRLRAEYQSQILAEYRCKWGKKSARPTAISQPIHHDHPFQLRQMMLFDPL